MNILIVDDEAPARERLRQLLADCATALPLTVVGEAANGGEALELLAELKVDVLLLDIRMPQMDGLEVAQHVQKLPQPPAVIFTTAYDHYAIEAFEVNAIDYLLKPIRGERLASALKKAGAFSAAQALALQQLSHRPRSHLSVLERGKIILVPVEEIVYLRAELKYVTVRTPVHEFLLEESLIRLEQEFAERFVRIHRNCLVARACIEGFERAPPGKGDEDASPHWLVLLKGLEEKLPVSRRQQHVVKELRSR